MTHSLRLNPNWTWSPHPVMVPEMCCTVWNTYGVHVNVYMYMDSHNTCTLEWILMNSEWFKFIAPFWVSKVATVLFNVSLLGTKRFILIPLYVAGSWTNKCFLSGVCFANMNSFWPHGISDDSVAFFPCSTRTCRITNDIHPLMRTAPSERSVIIIGLIKYVRERGKFSKKMRYLPYQVWLFHIATPTWIHLGAMTTKKRNSD